MRKGDAEWGFSMWHCRCVIGACLFGVLSGCALVDPLDTRYDTISRSLAKARNEAIFLNLVRASNDDPLNFVTIANVTPSLSNTSSFALPTFLLGPSPRNVEPSFNPGRDVVLGNTTAANTTAISTNFNVSTEETSAFYNGFLKPIDLQTLDYFIRQGYSRELLFWIFTQSVQIDLGRQKLLFAYNPPDDYGCRADDPKQRCFREFVLLAIYEGLTVEERAIQTMPSSRASGTGATVALNSSQSSNKPTTTSFFRFCFDQLLAKEAQNAMQPGVAEEIRTYLDSPHESFAPACGSSWNLKEELKQPQPDTLDFKAGPIKFRIKPRSAFGIFEFLGTMIKMQRDHPPTWPNAVILRPQVLEQPPTLKTVHDDEYVFTVEANRGGDCFAHTWFNNVDYCVPESALNTKRIFNLLAQLIAIETAATDLSITPIVRVVQ
jgi:hypothetical protein